MNEPERVTKEGCITNWSRIREIYLDVNTQSEVAMQVGGMGEPTRPVRFLESIRWAAQDGSLHPEDSQTIMKNWTSTR